VSAKKVENLTEYFGKGKEQGELAINLQKERLNKQITQLEMEIEEIKNKMKDSDEIISKEQDKKKENIQKLNELQDKLRKKKIALEDIENPDNGSGQASQDNPTSRKFSL